MTAESKPPYGLYLDIQATQSAEHGLRGIARYVSNQTSELLKIAGAVRSITLNPLLPAPLNLDQQLSASSRLAWSTVTEFRRAMTGGPLAYYLMSPFELGPLCESIVPPFAVRPGIPLVVSLYDLIPLLQPEYYLAEPNFRRRYAVRLETIKSADLVLTISGHSRSDAVGLLGLNEDRVVSIGAGVSPYFHPAEDPQKAGALVSRSLSRVSKPFVLCVSGAEQRKNTERVIDAYSRLPAELRHELQLVIVCRLTEAYARSWLEQVRISGLGEDQVVFTDAVPDPVLRALYQRAELFVFASLYEGFGLPAAEAAACDCPVITSNTSSMPEVLDHPESTFDPTDVDDISQSMHRALTDSEFREELKRAARRARSRHTWEAVAARTVHALEKLPAPHGRYAPPAPPRLRIALAGPFPPTVSGIADYNLRLSRELAELCDLTLLSAGPADKALAHPAQAIRWFPLRALGRTLSPASFDAVVYCFGNNEHHHLTYEMISRYPGLVWFHDVRLAGFYISYGLTKEGPSKLLEFMRDKLAAMYPQNDSLPEFTRPSLVAEDYAARGIGMTAELVRSARGLVVNSNLARRLLELDQPPLSSLPASTVISLAAPDPGPPASHERRRPPLVASFGIVAEVKAPELLIEALALMRKTTGVTLALVGPVNDDYRRRLESHAREAGVEEWFTLTGHVGPEDYRRYLQQASCAVQIRLATNGESSAAINDCLAAGLPVITNVAACLELPEGTVDYFGGQPDPQLVADRIGRLLSRPDVAARLAVSGLDYVKAHSFRQAAEQLLGFVSSMQSRAARPLAAGQ